LESTSRNQWLGRVASTCYGAITAEIVVGLEQGGEVAASVTLDAARGLHLECGRDVLVLIKAPMIMLAVNIEGFAFSARNQMSGEIVEIRDSASSVDVTMRLDLGGFLTATITQESRQELGLVPGQRVAALFNTASVLLATKRT
jgi:molybdate transport system regulatory protein